MHLPSRDPRRSLDSSSPVPAEHAAEKSAPGLALALRAAQGIPLDAARGQSRLPALLRLLPPPQPGVAQQQGDLRRIDARSAAPAEAA